MAEKAKEQASQLGEAAFSGAGNIAAATGLVKKEEFPADLKVRLPPWVLPCPQDSGTFPGLAGSPPAAPQPRGRDPEGPQLLGLCLGRAGVAAPSVPAACAAAVDVCVRGLQHGGRRRGPAAHRSSGCEVTWQLRERRDGEGQRVRISPPP